MTSTDNLSTILGAGYINQKVLGDAILPTDIFEVIYNYNISTGSGDEETFQVSISNGVITLIPNLNEVYTRIAITSADITGMYAAPLLLVPAPGYNLVLLPKQAMMILNYGGTTYTSGGVTNIQYTNIANGAGYYASANIAAASFTQTSGVIINIPCQFPSASNYEWTINQIADQGLYLSNQTNPFATGNGTGLLHLWYSVASLV
jgi:hypothetical protein